jgi:hypothetical protein
MVDHLTFRVEERGYVFSSKPETVFFLPKKSVYLFGHEK